MAARRRTGPMEAAVKRSIKALDTEISPADAGMVQLALTLARRFDHVSETGDEEQIGKLMWLTPHLSNVLKALGISPEGRRKSGVEIPTEEVDPIAELRAKRRAR
jgi:hypothetical protein